MARHLQHEFELAKENKKDISDWNQYYSTKTMVDLHYDDDANDAPINNIDEFNFEGTGNIELTELTMAPQNQTPETIWTAAEDKSLLCTLKITFSRNLGKKQNFHTIKFGVEPHLNKLIRDLGGTMSINKIHGGKKQFYVVFKCEWPIEFSKVNLPNDLIMSGPQYAMKIAVEDALKSDIEFKNELLKSFQCSDRVKNMIKIRSIEVEADVNSKAQYKQLINKLEVEQQTKTAQVKKKWVKSNIETKPLHRFTTNDICTKIEYWILHDSQYQKMVKDIRNIFASNRAASLTGSKIINMHDELASVLHPKISHFMTNETFEIIVDYIKELIAKKTRELKAKLAPEIGKDICWCATQKLLDAIMNEKDPIHGLEFLQRFENKSNWISDATGWKEVEIYQIESILLRHKTFTSKDMKQNIINNLLRNGFTKSLCQQLIDQISGSKIDLETMHLKIKNGYDITKESQMLMNIVYDLQELKKKDTTRKPPKPIISGINVNEKEQKMQIHFTAVGHDDIDCRAWFELELIDPYIYNANNDIIPNSEKYNYLLSILTIRHKSSPIILYPLHIGQEYIVRIKCVNVAGMTYSDVHPPILFKAPPPKPIFYAHRALDCEVLLQYGCPNGYSYPGTKYEIKVAPHHKQASITVQTKVRIDELRNGWDYAFTVRAINAFGQSEWSDKIKLRPLKKPKKPLELHSVAGDRCISIYWFSFDDMEQPDISGKFLVISDPPTTKHIRTAKHKVEFQALDNERLYRFKVFAMNKNFKVESDWTNPVRPSANKNKTYREEKKLVIDKIMKIRRVKLKKKEKKAVYEKHKKSNTKQSKTNEKKK
eukprot:408200_1